MGFRGPEALTDNFEADPAVTTTVDAHDEHPCISQSVLMSNRLGLTAFSGKRARARLCLSRQSFVLQCLDPCFFRFAKISRVFLLAPNESVEFRIEKESGLYCGWQEREKVQRD